MTFFHEIFKYEINTKYNIISIVMKGGDKKMEKIIIGVTAVAAAVISIGVQPLQFL